LEAIGGFVSLNPHLLLRYREADKVVTGSGKFEELVVCSQEVAASTTQLVVSSKVKAPRGSKNLPQLAEASRNVTDATGKVVASAKSAAQMIEDLGRCHARAVDLVSSLLKF